MTPLMYVLVIGLLPLLTRLASQVADGNSACQQLTCSHTAYPTPPNCQLLTAQLPTAACLQPSRPTPISPLGSLGNGSEGMGTPTAANGSLLPIR